VDQLVMTRPIPPVCVVASPGPPSPPWRVGALTRSAPCPRQARRSRRRSTHRTSGKRGALEDQRHPPKSTITPRRLTRSPRRRAAESPSVRPSQAFWRSSDSPPARIWLADEQADRRASHPLESRPRRNPFGEKCPVSCFPSSSKPPAPRDPPL